VTSRVRDTAIIGAVLLVASLAIFALWRALDSKPASDPAEDLAPRAIDDDDGDPGLLREPVASPETSVPEDPVPDVAPDEELSVPGNAPGLPLGIIHGTVCDSRTQEPVSELVVRFVGTGLGQSVRTDKDGSFRGRESILPPNLHATVTDRGTVVVERTELDPIFGPHVIGARLGPTYPLRFDSDEALPGDDWKARLVESRLHPGTPNALEVHEEGLRIYSESRVGSEEWTGADIESEYGSVDMSDRTWSWIPVRAGEDGPWVRFPTVEFEPDPSYRVRLEVRQRFENLVGSAPVESTVGRQAPVTVPVAEQPEHRACHLTGEVVFKGGGWSSTPVRVVLLPSAAELASTDRPPIFEEQRLDRIPTGFSRYEYFVFEHLPPGPRTLLVYADGRKLEQREVVLKKGLNEPAPIELARVKRRGRWWSEIRFDDPRPEEKGRGRYMSLLRLKAAGAYARAWLDLDGWTEGDRTKRVLAPAYTPDAEFVHLGIGLDLLPRWTPATAEFEASEAPIRLQLVADADLVPHGFEVSSSRNEEGPASFLVYFGPGGILETCDYASNTTRWKLPDKSPLRFTVWAPGFAPTCGTEADFRDENGERIAKVELDPGWGAVLHFRSGNPNTFAEDPGPWAGWTFPAASHRVGQAAPPIPGVGVEVNGKLVGHSDEEGMIRIAARKRPSLLVLDSPGWKVCATQKVGTSTFREVSFPYRYLVWMERE